MSRIVAVMAINRFPLWRKTFDQMTAICTDIFVRFDGVNGDPEILRELHAIFKDKASKLKGVSVSKNEWRSPEWREDCLRMLHNVGMAEGDIVLTPDEDETFGEGFAVELKAFDSSDKQAMRFSYASLESDHGPVNGGVPYPLEPHVKAFKWTKGLSYYPYHGNGMPAKHRNSVYRAKTKIHHWCSLTKGLENLHSWKNDIPSKGIRAVKAVTILGFGLSADEARFSGEVWSMNDCAMVLPKEIMRNVTRIFEMHDFDKRSKMLTNSGESYLGMLDRMGRMGHRIICQKPDPRVYGSEAFPLDEVRRRGMVPFFTGTPPYLLAMALLEGYNKITIYGIDQCDWEHTIQRNSWIFWCGVALGQGAELGGKISFIDIFGKEMYGYDWGPEMPDRIKDLMWTGWPFRISMKEESRAIRGDLYSNEPRNP